MKRSKVIATILTIIMLLSAMPSFTMRAAAMAFSDVPQSEWYSQAVAFVNQNGLMNGTGPSTFEPEGTTTRAMIVTILHRLEGQPLQGDAVFEDVPSGQWYTDAIAWASRNEIVNGYGNGSFGPMDPITREQMASILFRYAVFKQLSTSDRADLSQYSDVSRISTYAKEAISWTNASGLIQGKGNGILDPGGYATRAQVATILMRFVQQNALLTSGNNGGTENPWPLDSDLVVNNEEITTSVETPDELITATSQMINEYEGKVDIDGLTEEDIETGRYTGRVIVKTKAPLPDLSEYAPAAIIRDQDGYCYIQFLDASKAIECEAYLNTLAVVEYAEIDNVIAAESDVFTDFNGIKALAANSWGVSATGADVFSKKLYDAKKMNQITVAVLDTGVDATHPLLRGKVLEGKNIVDGNNNTSDIQQHGTHVAGTIIDCTAELNVKILPICVFKMTQVVKNGKKVYEPRASASVIGQGIRYAMNRGANVINLSLGGPHSNYQDDAISDAINNGIVVVVSAGNENINTSVVCPAHIESCITVAAVDSGLNRAYFSNYGNAVDVSAPGVNISSSVPGGGYQALNGTSMAAPHVSAAAAMILLNEPSLSPYEVEAKLRGAASDLGSSGWDQYYGSGFLNLKGIEVTSEAQNCQVSFDPNGGTCDTENKTVILGAKYGVLPVPVRAGYQFKGWYTDKEEGTEVSAETVVTLDSDHVLYARWVGREYRVSFVVNGGSAVEPLKVTHNERAAKPADPVREGFVFAGWYKDMKLTAAYDFDAPVTGDLTLYARWELKAPATYTVYFDAAGGSVDRGSMTVQYGQPYGTLPVPQRSYYRFDGWFTRADSGERITADKLHNTQNDITLYAHWVMNGVSDWVPVSDVPPNAQIVETMYKYNKTSYTTSSQKTMSGWTLYDTKSAWGAYGAWSGWSDQAVSASDSRQVETQRVIDSYTMGGYTYTDPNSPSLRGYWPYPTSNVLRQHVQNIIWTKAMVDTAQRLTDGTYYNPGANTGCNGVIHGGTAYVRVEGASHDYHPLFIMGTNYKTQYRYRDRSLSYTYYFKKTEQLTSPTRPSGNDISNVVQMVRYRKN